MLKMRYVVLYHYVLENTMLALDILLTLCFSN